MQGGPLPRKSRTRTRLFEVSSWWQTRVLNDAHIRCGFHLRSDITIVDEAEKIIYVRLSLRGADSHYMS